MKTAALVHNVQEDIAAKQQKLGGAQACHPMRP